MKIGSINIDHPIVLAPMDDHSDNAFRIICRDLEADVTYTEFANAEALIRNAKKTINKIQFTESERPIAIQIFGSNEESMVKSVLIAEALKPDFIDINCGCWVKKVANRGEGAGLLKDLPKMQSLINACVRATSLPVTVKTRLGWDENQLVIIEAAKRVEDSGAKALTVHCRTRCQGYSGKADWSWLPKIKEAISIPLIGNGDVRSPEDAKKMFDLGCDGVMIGREATNNPWVFKNSKHYLKTGVILEEPSLQERIDVCLKHLHLSYQFKGERGIFLMRKFYSHYLKGIPNISTIRKKLVTMTNFSEITETLHSLNQDMGTSA